MVGNVMIIVQISH